MKKMDLVKTLIVLSMVVITGYEVYNIITPKQYTYIEHTISAGETLMGIALKYGEKSSELDVRKIVWDIREVNRISSREVGNLQPGKVILIPIQK